MFQIGYFKKLFSSAFSVSLNSLHTVHLTIMAQSSTAVVGSDTFAKWPQTSNLLKIFQILYFNHVFIYLFFIYLHKALKFLRFWFYLTEHLIWVT